MALKRVSVTGCCLDVGITVMLIFSFSPKLAFNVLCKLISNKTRPDLFAARFPGWIKKCVMHKQAALSLLNLPRWPVLAVQISGEINCSMFCQFEDKIKMCRCSGENQTKCNNGVNVTTYLHEYEMMSWIDIFNTVIHLVRRVVFVTEGFSLAGYKCILVF